MKAFVHIQSIDKVLEQFGHLEHKISAEEMGKINRHSHERGKTESLAIRLQLLGLCELLNIDTHVYPVHYLHSGKPVLRTMDWYMSWSHSKGVAATIISDCPIGIDVEADRPVHAGLYRKTLHPIEINNIVQQSEYQQKEIFLKKWVIKEAYLKMAGLSIAHHITNVVVNSDFSKVEYIRPNGTKSLNQHIYHKFNDVDWYHTAIVSEHEIDLTFLGVYKR